MTATTDTLDNSRTREEADRNESAGGARIRVLVAEDHPLVREGLCRLLAGEAQVLDAVTDGRTLLEAAERLQPDVVLIDITMPGLNGLESVRQLRRRCPECRVIFLTAHIELTYVREAFRVGAAGYVTKHSAFKELLTAIREVLAGRRYLSRALDLDIEALLAENASAPAPITEQLTPRQREVLQLIAEGHTARQIGEALNISRKTAEYHRAELVQALGLPTTAELTRYALKHGVSGD